MSNALKNVFFFLLNFHYIQYITFLDLSSSRKNQKSIELNDSYQKKRLYLWRPTIYLHTMVIENFSEQFGYYTKVAVI